MKSKLKLKIEKIPKIKLSKLENESNKIIKKPNSIDIFILTILSLFHSLFSLSSTLFILLTPFNVNSGILNGMVIFVVLTFILFRRCIAVDIYDTISDLAQVDYADLPNMAKDNYLKKSLQCSLSGDQPDIIKKKMKKGLRHLRLDIIESVKPLMNCRNEVKMKKMYNHRLHYILINIILCVMLMYKFKCIKFMPLLIVWIFYNFEL